jgi:hypothetical protein
MRQLEKEVAETMTEPAAFPAHTNRHVFVLILWRIRRGYCGGQKWQRLTSKTLRMLG